MNPAQIEALDRRLRGQDVIPNRNEVADFVTILADENATLRADGDKLISAVEYWSFKAAELMEEKRASEAALATQLAETHRLMDNARQIERNVQAVREHEHKRAEAALAELARVTAQRDALKAAKWDVQHTDTMNDFVLLGIDRDEKETALTTANRRIAALTEALEGCVAAIEHADMADGVCCCGDMMEGHSDPMSCGHSPVDQGHYHSHQVLASARAALTTDKELKT